MDRAFRIGQQKDVLVLRLVVGNSVEVSFSLFFILSVTNSRSDFRKSFRRGVKGSRN